MTLAISSDLNNARLAAVVSFLDQGATGAKVQIFAGVRPAAGAAAGSTPLVEIALAKPSGTVDAGVLTIATTDEPLVYTGGQATWARVVSGAGAWAFDADVSDTTGTGDFKMPNVVLYAGGTARLTSGKLR